MTKPLWEIAANLFKEVLWEALDHLPAICVRANSPAMTPGSGPSLHWMWCLGPALRSARRCDSLEECDDGFCEDVIAITGDHMGSVGHVDILGVRALFEEALGPCLA